MGLYMHLTLRAVAVLAVLSIAAGCAPPQEQEEEGSTESHLEGSARSLKNGVFIDTFTAGTVSAVDSFALTIPGKRECRTTAKYVTVTFRMGEISRDVFELDSVEVTAPSDVTAARLVANDYVDSAWFSGNTATFAAKHRFDIRKHHYVEGTLYIDPGLPGSTPGDISSDAWCGQSVSFMLAVE